MSKTWSNPVWFFFHGLAEKVHDDFYIENSKACLNIVKKICAILPCPMCRSAATRYMRKIKYQHVQTKENFKRMLFNFHNYVNRKLRKRMFLEKDLQIYTRLKFIKTTQLMCYQLRRFNNGMFRTVASKNSDAYINQVENSVKKYIKYFI